jgi:type IV secretory pathway TrbL component
MRKATCGARFNSVVQATACQTPECTLIAKLTASLCVLLFAACCPLFAVALPVQQTEASGYRADVQEIYAGLSNLNILGNMVTATTMDAATTPDSTTTRITTTNTAGAAAATSSVSAANASTRGCAADSMHIASVSTDTTSSSELSKTGDVVGQRDSQYVDTKDAATARATGNTDQHEYHQQSSDTKENHQQSSDTNTDTANAQQPSSLSASGTAPCSTSL